MSDFDAIFCVVGEKGDLTDAHLTGVLAHLNDTVLKNTTGPVHLAMHGYDYDPRELWEIPEVRAYLRRRTRGLNVELVMRLDELSKILLGVCSGMLRPIGRDPVTGNTTFEATGR